MQRYTVRCQFTGQDPVVIERWLAWLRDPHIADVMAGGATGAEVVKMSDQVPTYEIRYQFASEADFQTYLSQHAPSLRDEGLKLFPPEELGLSYSRTDGQVIHSTWGNLED